MTVDEFVRLAKEMRALGCVVLRAAEFEAQFLVEPEEYAPERPEPAPTWGGVALNEHYFSAK